ncbi:MAG: DNA translocase FtsK [Patescibacteria group bacterium]
MGRKKKKEKKGLGEWLSNLQDETRHSMLGVLFIALAVFFSLAGVNYAGLIGRWTYSGLSALMGAGFILLPIVTAGLGISFLMSIKPKIISHRLSGGALFFLSTLGLISLIFNQDSGGLIGNLIAEPMVRLFDLYISLVFLGSLALVAVMITFDTRITLEGKLFGLSLFGRRHQLSEDEDYPEEEENWEEEPEEEKEEAEPVKTPVEATPVKDDSAGLLKNLSGWTGGGSQDFTPPPLKLLNSDSGKPGSGDIKANANIIKRTLTNFGINVEMDEVSVGPSITRYALKPAEGVKLSRILGLQNDLSLALAAHPIRIEAPIPGRSLVGIEIPNSTKTTIGLATLLGGKDFTQSPWPLTVTLGRGISGGAHYANLTKAPHMLIAGATGAGKSVTIHALITSLLYQKGPDKLRFIMIDPKRVELTMYNKIPHLLTPVITDPKKTIAALRWAAGEMERRYNILEAEAVRDIQSYHKNVVDPYLKQKKKQETQDEQEDIDRMPYIVIIIDELADIMSTYPRELEAAVVRLAQMSRAVGIHLILSTQRPSVEVITGLIKANIPARIALQVASQVDSRTIIDMAGAEKLLGAGDMLYISGEMSKPFRIQSAFISEEEVKKVVKWIADHYTEEAIGELALEEALSGQSGDLARTALDGQNDNNDDDELYEDAREAVIEGGKASASYLQRKLKVGYARAARLLDMLEERGVVGPGEGAKPRDVYIKPGQETESE